MFDLTLTFDNGPEPETTPQVLDVLGRRGIAATFFIMGRKLSAAGGRALVERARDEGHWIGNHTWSHGAPLGEREDPLAPDQEIGRTQALLGELAHPDRLFRPNAGGELGPHVLSPAAVDHLRRGGYTCVLWNAVPRDWIDPEGWVETALAQCASRPWSLLVLHDLPTGAMRHLDRFLGAAEAAGARWRQDFPPECTPLRRGQMSGDLDALTTQRG